MDVVQPDLHWCGGLSEALRIYYIAEAAGIKTSPHGGANSAYGQHLLYALPECTLGEYAVATPVGVPLEEMRTIPGVPVAKDGTVVPSDAPGFGMEIPEDWIASWVHGRAEGEVLAVL